jgi:polysaccharide transporter, PST family
MTIDDDYYPDVLPAGGLKARSVRGGTLTALVQLPKILLMFASQLVLARLLMPRDFGLVAMVTPVIGFVQVLADLGLTQAVVSRPRLRHAELNSFFWINMALSAGLALVAAATGPLLALLYGEPRVIAVTAACAALVLVTGAGMLPGALLNRRMRYGALAGSEVAALAVSVTTGAAFAWWGWGYWSLVAAQAGASLTATCLNWVLAGWRPRAPALDAGAVAMARFGGNLTVSNLAGYLNMTLDNVMIGAVLGSVVLGLYDRAWKLAVQPLSQIQAPFHRVAVPALSRLADDPERYRQAFRQMTGAMLLVVAPAMIFAGLFARPLIALLLGERWLPAAPIFAWLCVGAALTPVNSATFWLFVSQGRAREQMIYGTAAAAINVAAYATGLPWGIAAVAAVSAVSVYAIQTPMLLHAAAQEGPVGGADLRRLLLPHGAGGVTAAIAGWLLAARLPGATAFWTEFATLAGAGAAVGAAYLAGLAVFPEGRAQLRALAALPAALRGRRTP